MPAIRWVPISQVIGAVPNLPALVSLAILDAVDSGRFGVVDHKIPIVPWCRGHLAMMAKQICMKNQVADRFLRLKRDQERMAQDANGYGAYQPQHGAKRAKMEASDVRKQGDLSAGAAPPTPYFTSSTVGGILSRNVQAAHASVRHAEQMYVWHTQNIAAREAMAAPVHEGKSNT